MAYRDYCFKMWPCCRLYSVLVTVLPQFLLDSLPAVSSLGAWFNWPFSCPPQMAWPKRKGPFCQALFLQGCRGGGRVCILRQRLQITTCKGFGDLWSLWPLSQRKPYSTSPWFSVRSSSPCDLPENAGERSQIKPRRGKGGRQRRKYAWDANVNAKVYAIFISFSGLILKRNAVIQLHVVQ